MAGRRRVLSMAGPADLLPGTNLVASSGTE